MTGLSAALEEFAGMNAAAYTAESFGAYTKAVAEAQAIAESSTGTQEALNAAVAKVAQMKELLRTADTVSEKVIISSAKSRSTRVVKGKAVTITLVANERIQGVEVYDDLGNRVMLRVYSVARTSTDTKYTVTFQFIENNKGTRTYTIYVVDQDGNRSADHKQCKVLCY
jgi:pectate lyase